MNLLTHCALCGHALKRYRPKAWEDFKSMPCPCTEASVRVERKADTATPKPEET